jgi:hypothetical protein
MLQFLILAFGIDVISLSVLDVICSSILLVCMIRLIPVIIIMLYYWLFRIKSYGKLLIFSTELAAGLRAVGLWLCRRAGTQVVLDNGGELLAVSCQQRTVLPPCGSVLQETEVGGREGKRRLGAPSRVEVALGRDEGHGRMGRTGLVSLRLLRPSGPLHGEVRERRREELHQEASGSRGSDRTRWSWRALPRPP